MIIDGKSNPIEKFHKTKAFGTPQKPWMKTLKVLKHLKTL